MRFGRRGRGGRDKQGGQEVDGMNGANTTFLLSWCDKAPTQQRRQPPAALVAGHAFSLHPPKPKDTFDASRPRPPPRRWLPVKRLGCPAWSRSFPPIHASTPVSLPAPPPLPFLWSSQSSRGHGRCQDWHCLGHATLSSSIPATERRSRGGRTDHSLLAHDVQKINPAAWPWLLPRPLSSTLGQ